MKILIYTDYYKQPSGFAREVKDMLPFLKKDNEIAQVALDYNGFPLERGDITVFPTKVESVKTFWAPEVLLYAIEQFKPDIVFTLQDYYVLPRISFHLAHPGTFKWVHWGLCDGEPLGQGIGESLRWVHQHVFHTEFTKKTVQKAVPEIDGEVINPSVDRNVFKIIENKEALKAKYKLNGRKVVLCVARSQIRKNLPVLLEAFKIVVSKIPEAVLIMAGHTPKSASMDEDIVTAYNIERFVTEMGLDDYVLMPKRSDGVPIDDETLNIQYNLADVNVLTSTGEGFGLPFIEAGACHVPSIGTNCSAVPEAIGEGGVLVEPTAYMYTPDGVKQHLVRPEDVANSIISLLNNEPLRKELGEKAFERAKVLTPESRAQKFLEIFQNTITNNVMPIAIKK